MADDDEVAGVSHRTKFGMDGMHDQTVMLPDRPGISSDYAWFGWTIMDAVRAWHHETAPN